MERSLITINGVDKEYVIYCLETALQRIKESKLEISNIKITVSVKEEA